MQTYKFPSDLQQECLAHMRANDIPFDGPLKCDGQIHRFSMDAKKNQPDEWYACHDGFSAKGNPYVMCNYGTWSGGQEQYTYKSYDINSSLSYEEWMAIKAKVEEKQKRIEQELKADVARRILRAQEKWEQATAQAITALLRAKNGTAIPLGKVALFSISQARVLLDFLRDCEHGHRQMVSI